MCMFYMKLSVLEPIGLDKRNLILHSLRAGGTTAAANAGICDRLLKKTADGAQIQLKTVMSKRIYL